MEQWVKRDQHTQDVSLNFPILSQRLRRHTNNALTTVAKVWGTAYGIAISPFVAAGIVGATSSLTAIAAPQIASYSIAGTMYFNMSMISTGRFISRNPNFFSNTYEFASNIITGVSASAPTCLYGITGASLNYTYNWYMDHINSYNDDGFGEYELNEDALNPDNYSMGDFDFGMPSFD